MTVETPADEKLFWGPEQAKSTRIDSDVAVSDAGSFHSAQAAPDIPGEAAKDNNNDEDGCSPDDNVLLKNVLANWSGNTSVHGIAWMVDENSNALWHRLLWALFTLAGAGVMIWQIQALVRDYREYEVETNTVIKWPNAIDFPDVTVCNLNKFRFSYLESNNFVDPKTLHQIHNASQQLEEFIIETKFNGNEIVNLSSVWRERITGFGKCFTFQTDKQVKIPGVEGGLQFYANIDQDEYHIATQYAGVRVFVTDRDAPVNQQVPFAAAKPGRKAYVNIKSAFYDRVKKQPWSRCSDERSHIPPVVCRVTCIAELVRKNCSCQVLGDPTEPPLEFCAEDFESHCAGKVNFTLAEEECDPQCLPNCLEWRYQTSISDFEYANHFLDFLSALFNISSELFTDNIVDVSVNFETISYEEQTEKEAISFNELLAAIGGSMGLFLGVSVLSFVELSDLIFLRVLPRFFGVRHLFGVGGKNFQKYKTS